MPADAVVKPEALPRPGGWRIDAAMTADRVREAWIALPGEDEVRALLPPGHPYDFGFIPAMIRLVTAHPRIAPFLGALVQQVMFEPGALGLREREMIAAVTAAVQDCRYCADSHAEFLRVEGGDAALVRAIKQHRWRDVEGLSPRDRALCTLAEKLSATPSRVVEDDWQPLRTLGFDDAACLEVAHVVGLFNYLARLANGFGLQLDPATLAAAEGGVPLKRPA